jgi:hypothetical protein
VRGGAATRSLRSGRGAAHSGDAVVRLVYLRLMTRFLHDPVSLISGTSENRSKRECARFALMRGPRESLRRAHFAEIG